MLLSDFSRELLSDAFPILRELLKTNLKSTCMHIKERGGVKGAIRWIHRRVGDFKFAARFDIASYYESMDHSVILNLLKKIGVSEELRNIVCQYVKVPDIANLGRGLPAGGAISPLIGAVYLMDLDKAMQLESKKGNIFYIRYQDGFLILAKTRWHFRRAIKKVREIVSSLRVNLHEKKR